MFFDFGFGAMLKIFELFWRPTAVFEDGTDFVGELRFCDFKVAGAKRGAADEFEFEKGSAILDAIFNGDGPGVGPFVEGFENPAAFEGAGLEAIDLGVKQIFKVFGDLVVIDHVFFVGADFGKGGGESAGDLDGGFGDGGHRAGAADFGGGEFVFFFDAA